MISHHRTFSVGRFAALAFLSSSKRFFFVSAFPNKTTLDGMLSPSNTNQSPYVVFEHITTPVGSTQDEARRLLRQRAIPPGKQFLAVIADSQMRGRGTQGRQWEGEGERKGNLYLTICIPFEEIPVQITLLPLQVAVLVAERVSKLIAACGSNPTKTAADTGAITTVKWPNDVLVNDKKISGTLIESEIIDGVSWFLIGIGVNIGYAPDLTKSPGKSARKPTCIQDHCCNDENGILPPNAAYIFGSDLANALVDWTMDKADKQRREISVIDSWKSFAKFGQAYELRGEVPDEDAGRHVGEVVTSVDIQYDGQLLVKGQDGKERLLIADYLF